MEDAYQPLSQATDGGTKTEPITSTFDSHTSLLSVSSTGPLLPSACLTSLELWNKTAIPQTHSTAGLLNANQLFSNAPASSALTSGDILESAARGNCLATSPQAAGVTPTVPALMPTFDPQTLTDTAASNSRDLFPLWMNAFRNDSQSEQKHHQQQQRSFMSAGLTGVEKTPTADIGEFDSRHSRHCGCLNNNEISPSASGVGHGVLASFTDKTTCLAANWPSRLDALLRMSSLSIEEQMKYAWDQSDCSDNIFVKARDPFTFYRHPAAQSTDGIRGRHGFSRGIHLWRIRWNVRQRGSHAVIGVGTSKASLKTPSYQALVGRTVDSWGWDIIRCRALHDARTQGWRPYPLVAELRGEVPAPGSTPSDSAFKDKPFRVPETIFVILDMDEGTLSFATKDQFLGVAFNGLAGKTVYPIVSAVWGHCEVTMHYLTGMPSNPLTLTQLCRHSLRGHLIRQGVARLAVVDQLALPIAVKDYLLYRNLQHRTRGGANKRRADTMPTDSIRSDHHHHHHALNSLESPPVFPSLATSPTSTTPPQAAIADATTTPMPAADAQASYMRRITREDAGSQAMATTNATTDSGSSCRVDAAQRRVTFESADLRLAGSRTRSCLPALSANSAPLLPASSDFIAHSGYLSSTSASSSSSSLSASTDTEESGTSSAVRRSADSRDLTSHNGDRWTRRHPATVGDVGGAVVSLDDRFSLGGAGDIISPLDVTFLSPAYAATSNLGAVARHTAPFHTNVARLDRCRHQHHHRHHKHSQPVATSLQAAATLGFELPTTSLTNTSLAATAATTTTTSTNNTSAPGETENATVWPTVNRGVADSIGAFVPTHTGPTSLSVTERPASPGVGNTAVTASLMTGGLSSRLLSRLR